MKEKKLLDAKKNARKILETKISSKREQIARNQNSAIDLNDAKTTANVELKILEESQMSLLSKLNTNIAECIKRNDDKLKIVLSETLVKRRLQYSSKKLSNSEVEYQDIKNEVLRLQNSLNDLKNEAKILRNKAKAESGFDVNTDLSEEIRVKFDAMPNSIEEIDNKIGTLRLRMESILDADESVRDSYNKRRRDIERRQKDLKMKKIELKEKETKLETIKNRWLPSLEELIAKINSNFGRFMARLNCAGEVSLYRGNDVITNPFNFNEFYFNFIHISFTCF
jgi:chromosome segregation ATPase